MNIFARFYFRAARLEREKRENKCSAKISKNLNFDWQLHKRFQVTDEVLGKHKNLVCQRNTAENETKQHDTKRVNDTMK